MKPQSFILICIQVMLSIYITQGQVAISADGSKPDNSAMLDVQSSHKGMLVPRMTEAQRDLIENPATGLVIFQTDSPPGLYYNSGTPGSPAWASVGTNAAQWKTTSAGLYYNDGQVGIGTQTPDNSALIDMSSITKGFLPPRMTQSEIAAISSPADGLIAYCTTDGKLYTYVSSANAWKEILFGSGIISPTFPCGSTITINHTEGPVAPVTKTVIYSTVGNIPGEPSKCWVTSNLGADHQANSVDDSTEASAGWYWQFDVKQGYECTNGSNISPLWSSLNITDNSNWVLTNDPCNLELGNGWRIPTYTEWYNIDAAGGWTDWNGPWNSALKLHAAGIIQPEGSLNYRGVHGNYWSSTQRNNSMAYNLFFIVAYCQLVNDYKTMGTPIRCLREQ
jgi:hypothetical protein